MPNYDYWCSICGEEELDVTVTLSELDTHQVVCVCGEVMHRIISAKPVILKGSCWSRDGYSRTVGDKLKFEGKKCAT